MSGLVVQCYHSSLSNKAEIELSFNTYSGKRHNSAISNRSQVTGFNNLQASYENGQLVCGWQLPHGQSVKYEDIKFDFEHEKYYIQLAIGPVDPSKNKFS